MTYNEWLKSIEFGLKRRYKVVDISVKDIGMKVIFTNNFIFYIDSINLKELHENYKLGNNSFLQLCKEIENDFLKKILDI